MRDPINPADIRVGDRVERVSEARGVETTFRCVITRIEGGLIHAGGLGWSVLDGSQWYLLDRPDPLAEVVAEVTRALWRYYEAEGEADPEPDSEYSMAYLSAARTIVAAIFERWELVEKSG